MLVVLMSLSLKLSLYACFSVCLRSFRFCRLWILRFSIFGFQGTILLRLSSAAMGLSGLEPPTSRLSGVRSNRLSYKPRLMSKCADAWSSAAGACTRKQRSMWMHKRRSRGMTNHRFGIPALTPGIFLLSLLYSFSFLLFDPAAACFPVPSPAQYHRPSRS